ncbi:hypothetical protein BJV82DRAFT_576268 [Fennellomyces sp. T-0311]|nr:hypothetical protein BJV82DRAFT_576268 [Fennellomyces sp. T-0311]
MTDIGFENLRISDHHNPGSDRELPLPPAPQHGNYDYYHDQQPHQQQQQHYASPPPGIAIDGEMWHGNDDYYDDEDDDKPLGSAPPPPHHQQPLVQLHQDQQQALPPPVARPVSYRNQAAIQINSNRPARFIKADQLTNASAAQSLPPDLQNIQRLYEQYHLKIYMEGYLYRKAESKRMSGDETWIRSYVELSGSVLTLWDADLPGDGEVLPQYVNISDTTTVELNEHGMVSLKTGSTNRYLFEYVDDNTGETDRNTELEKWVRAIRLSCFEGTRIHEIYTKKFIMRNKNVQDGDDDDDVEEDLLSKPMSKMEGFVQVRFANSNEWQKYWVVVSDRRSEKKLFGKKSVPSHGQLMFYESKKAKHPIMTLVNVTQAYTVYPETPQLIDMVTLLKVDGRVPGEDEPQDMDPSLANTTSVLLMTSSTIELVQWLVGVFDAFKLYGRPSGLIRDPTNPGALNFGEIVSGDRLFLEVDELQQMNVREDNMAKNRAMMTQLVANKLKQQITQRHPGAPAPAPGGMGPRTNSMPQIAPANNGNRPPPRQRTVSADPDQNPRATMMNNGQFAPGPGPARGSMHPMGHPGMVQQGNMMQQPPMMQQQRPMAPPMQGQHAPMQGYPPMQGQHPQVQQPQQPRASVMPPRSQSGKVIYASDESDDEDEDDEEDSDDDDDSVFGGSSKKATDNNSKNSSPSLAKKLPASSSTLSIPEIKTDSSSLLDAVNEATSEKKKKDIRRDSDDSDDDTPASPVKHKKNVSDSESDETEDEEEKKIAKARKAGPRPSLSESDEESEEDDSEDDGSSVENYTPHRPKSRWPQQAQAGSSTPELNNTSPSMYHHQQQQNSFEMDPQMAGMYNQYDQYYYQQNNNLARGQPVIDEDGPVIPQLGENFANPHSLLGSVRQDQGASIRDQAEYAKATGQPLVQLAQKQSAPRAGLVGMISQIEQDKKDPHKGRLAEVERERMMERERYMMEQRQQSMMNPMMGMMDPRMSMMPPNMMMGMMDPRMSMMPPNMMGGSSSSNNQHPSMMMMPPMMDPRMSMMPPNMMGGAGNNQHASMMMMPPMMDPRMSMMPPNMMMYNMYGYNNQFNSGQVGNQGIREEDDEDDDVPIGAGSHSAGPKSHHRHRN